MVSRDKDGSTSARGALIKIQSYPHWNDCPSEEQSLLSFRGFGCSGAEEDVTFWQATAAEDTKIKFRVIRTICGGPRSGKWLWITRNRECVRKLVF